MTNSEFWLSMVGIVIMCIGLFTIAKYLSDINGTTEVVSPINENLSDINEARFRAEMRLFSVKSDMIGESYSDRYKNDLEVISMCLDDISLSLEREKRK